MKRKKDVIKKAVLASVLAMSLNNVVWAAEGVDQPFSTVSELEALGGIASIDSSSISHVTKGIYASGNDFIYNSGAIKLDINGFANSTNSGYDSIGIFGYNSTIDLKQIEMNFIDTSGTVHNLDVYGVKTLKLDIPLVPETRINWAFVPLHIAIIYILKLCLDEEIIPRCRFPCSRGYLTKCINWQKK